MDIGGIANIHVTNNHKSGQTVESHSGFQYPEDKRRSANRRVLSGGILPVWKDSDHV